MTLQTFNPPIPPSPGTTRKPEVKLFESEFGDGYTQTTPAGLNHMRQTIELSWDVLTQAQADQIVDFLAEHGGHVPFYYTPPGRTEPVKWTCKDWQETDGKAGTRSLKASLRQNFGLVS